MSLGSIVSVRGIVTAEAGRLGTAPLIALGDDAGGIFIRLSDGITLPARGDQVVVSGTLADPYGQVEIRTTVGGIVPLATRIPLPAPVAVGSAELGEATEGRLVTLGGMVEHAPTKSSGGLALWVIDDAGDRARVLTGGSSGVAAADLVAGHRYRLTGIVGQRASRKGALDGYRLWVRDRADIVQLGRSHAVADPDAQLELRADRTRRACRSPGRLPSRAARSPSSGW